MRTLRRLPGRTRSLRARSSVIALALLVGGTLAVRGAADNDADLQLQLATLLYDETRYQEALQAFDQAAQATDPLIALRGRKGSVRTSLKVAEFGRAKREAETLRTLAPKDPEAIALYGDALWSAGLFDEADRAYRDGLALAPDSSRARFGVARSLAATSRLDESLDMALAASAV